MLSQQAAQFVLWKFVDIMDNPNPLPRPGQAVVVRNRPGVVEDVTASPSSAEGKFHYTTVRYIDGWRHPERDRLLWEREPAAQVIDRLAWPDIENRRPDAPDYFDAFLDANRWSATNKMARSEGENERDVNLVAPWYNAIQIEDYQLYPLLKALLMPRVNLLLADDVGLGKTIEAGLIMSELLIRRRIRRVLIVCPASLQKQWQEEMRDKFHLDFTLVDRNRTFELKREMGMDSNPWSTYPRIVTSQDYLRQQDVLASFDAATQTLARNKTQLPWDLLIVDEAHNFAPRQYGDESDRCKMLREISQQFEHRLFLTATPHDGYTLSFTGLLKMLDPVRFSQTQQMSEKEHQQKKTVMIRRLKSDLLKEGKGRRFARRMPPQALELDLTDEEAALYAALRNYRTSAAEVLKREGPQEQHIGHFLTSLLTKRLLSSSYAFACTWWQHIEGLEHGEVSTEQVDHARQRAETELDDDEEKEQRQQDAARQGGGWFTRYSRELEAEQRAVGRALTQLGWTPDSVDGELDERDQMPGDAKWERLSQWIDDNLTEDGELRDDERLIIFTEYKHTLDYVMTRLQQRGIVSPQVEALFGGASTARREQVKQAFNDPQSPLRILVATDTAAEGINLQTSCRYVIHYEIPWNPMRLEQRNGRVDRHGQARDVYVHHFTSAEEADLRFLSRVVNKVEQVREDLGSVGRVIDQTVMEHFSSAEPEGTALEQRVDTIPEERADKQELEDTDRGSEEDYEKAFHRLRATEMSMGLKGEHLARLLETALALEGGELAKTDDEAELYSIRKVPPGWEKLVEEDLVIDSGRLQGQKPRLVFEPGELEKNQEGLRVLEEQPDIALIRLGHPIMERAMGVLQRCMWEEGAIGRWTIRQTNLPSGVDRLCVLRLLLEVTNELREKAHEEVLTVPFQASDGRLIPLEESLWEQIGSQTFDPLDTEGRKRWVDSVRGDWLQHRSQLESYVEEKRQHLTEEYDERMEQCHEEVDKRMRESYSTRLRELGQKSTQKAHQKQIEVLQDKRRLMAEKGLFPEIQEDMKQTIKELEWEVYHSNIERTKRILRQERERMLENVLPARYSLASLNLQPLTVEYVVAER